MEARRALHVSVNRLRICEHKSGLAEQENCSIHSRLQPAVPNLHGPDRRPCHLACSTDHQVRGRRNGPPVMRSAREVTKLSPNHELRPPSRAGNIEQLDSKGYSIAVVMVQDERDPVAARRQIHRGFFCR